MGLHIFPLETKMKHVIAAVMVLSGLVLAQAAGAAGQAPADRKAAIEFYLSGYIGDDIALENAGCVKPAIPDVSSTKQEIGRVSADYAAWRECYNKFIEKLGTLMPLGSAIPADLQKAMSPAELEQARNRLGKVYAVVAEDGQAEARDVMLRYDAWNAKTSEFVRLENARLKSKQQEIDQMNRDFAEKMDMAPRKHVK
jgi:hypothetical protein